MQGFEFYRKFNLKSVHKFFGIYLEIESLVLFQRCGSMGKIKRILLVDSDASSASICAAAFEEHGFSVDRVSNGLSAMERIDSVAYDFVITELDLYYLRGADLYARAIKKRPGLKDRFLFISASEPKDERERDMVFGRFLLKPLSADSVVEHVLDILKHRVPLD